MVVNEPGLGDIHGAHIVLKAQVHTLNTHTQPELVSQGLGFRV